MRGRDPTSLDRQSNQRNDLMEINLDLVSWLAPAWALFSLAITVATWALAKPRVDSPGWVTACNALLCFSPPLNVLVLALIAIKDIRPEK